MMATYHLIEIITHSLASVAHAAHVLPVASGFVADLVIHTML